MRVGVVVSTLYYPRRPAWMARVESIDRAALSRRALLTQLVRASATCDVMVLDGAVGIRAASPDLAAAALAARRRRPPAIIMAECTWKAGRSGWERSARRAGIAMMDRAVSRYCVISSAERDHFGPAWGVRAAKVVYTPFYFTLTEEELSEPVSEGGGVFAGGDSMRDYEPLLAAARRLGARVTVACGSRSVATARDRPENVRVGRVPHTEFMRLMRGADVVVVPMSPGITRSAGQQTYLNAMALGKIVVVTDSPGARDHVEHERTGFIVPPGDARALRAALDTALDPRSEPALTAMRRAAQETARTRFTADAYVASLLAVVDAVDH